MSPKYPKVGEFTCDCGKVFTSNEALQEHQQNCDSSVEENEKDGFKVENNDKDENDTLKTEKDLECEECEDTFDSKQELKDHEDECIKKEKEGAVQKRKTK